MTTPKPQLVLQLVRLGLAEMKSTGQWGLTREGEDFLDQLDLMRELDDREPEAE